MQVDGNTLAIVAVLLLALLIFIVVKNKKDRKKFEQQLNRDFKRPNESTQKSDADDINTT